MISNLAVLAHDDHSARELLGYVFTIHFGALTQISTESYRIVNSVELFLQWNIRTDKTVENVVRILKQILQTSKLPDNEFKGHLILLKLICKLNGDQSSRFLSELKLIASKVTEDKISEVIEISKFADWYSDNFCLRICCILLRCIIQRDEYTPKLQAYEICIFEKPCVESLWWQILADSLRAVQSHKNYNLSSLSRIDDEVLDLIHSILGIGLDLPCTFLEHCISLLVSSCKFEKAVHLIFNSIKARSYPLDRVFFILDQAIDSKWIERISKLMYNEAVRLHQVRGEMQKCLHLLMLSFQGLSNLGQTMEAMRTLELLASCENIISDESWLFRVVLFVRDNWNSLSFTEIFKCSSIINIISPRKSIYRIALDQEASTFSSTDLARLWLLDAESDHKIFSFDPPNQFISVYFASNVDISERRFDDASTKIESLVNFIENNNLELYSWIAFCKVRLLFETILCGRDIDGPFQLENQVILYIEKCEQLSERISSDKLELMDSRVFMHQLWSVIGMTVYLGMWSHCLSLCDCFSRLKCDGEHHLVCSHLRKVCMYHCGINDLEFDELLSNMETLSVSRRKSGSNLLIEIFECIQKSYVNLFSSFLSGWNGNGDPTQALISNYENIRHLLARFQTELASGWFLSTFGVHVSSFIHGSLLSRAVNVCCCLGFGDKAYLFLEKLRELSLLSIKNVTILHSAHSFLHQRISNGNNDEMELEQNPYLDSKFNQILNLLSQLVNNLANASFDESDFLKVVNDLTQLACGFQKPIFRISGLSSKRKLSIDKKTLKLATDGCSFFVDEIKDALSLLLVFLMRRGNIRLAENILTATESSIPQEHKLFYNSILSAISEHPNVEVDQVLRGSANFVLMKSTFPVVYRHLRPSNDQFLPYWANSVGLAVKNRLLTQGKIELDEKLISLTDLKIPENLTVVMLDLVDESKIMVCRLEKDLSPFLETIGVTNFSSNSSANFLEQFEHIMTNAKESTHSGCDVNSKEAVKGWIEQRRFLEKQLSSLLSSVDERILGHLTCLLSGIMKCEESFSFPEELVQQIRDQDQMKKLRLILQCIDRMSARSLEKALSWCFGIDFPNLKKLTSLLLNFAKKERLSDKRRGPVVLVIGDKIAGFPWENLPSLQCERISRVPSMHLLRRLLSKSNAKKPLTPDLKACSYILNPGNDLPRTQATFEEFFSKSLQWKGISGREPSKKEFIDILEQSKIFVYCGHSGGQQYMSKDSVRKLDIQATSILLGCSSGKLKSEGIFESDGICLSYLIAGCPAVIGNLWDVTDLDIDRFGLQLLKQWNGAIGKKDLLDSIIAARNSCKLRYLTASAPVCYGVPCVD